MKTIYFLCFSLLSGSLLAQNGAIPGYQDDRAFADHLQKLDKRDSVQSNSLTNTLGKREVVLMTIGTGEVHKKPAILIVGSTHAQHLLGSELAMRIADKLSDGSEQSNQLIQRHTFYIIPRPNPDASASFFKKPYHAHSTNQRPMDDDNDGELDEDPPDDLNGDGQIIVMRVAEPGGEWTTHPDDPRIMVKADPAKGESGTYNLYAEGLDDDGDGEFNEDDIGGTAFDRNLTFDYPYFESGAGPHMVSERESRAIVEFIFDHPNIAAVFSFGPRDNLKNAWKVDKKNRNESLNEKDEPYYKFMLKKYGEINNTKDAPEALSRQGSFVHWAYFHYGRWSFQARAWWPTEIVEEKKEVNEGNNKEEPKEEGKEKKKEEKKKPDDRAKGIIKYLKWMDANKIDGFADWEKIDHPDFPGKLVEIGGIKPFHTLNPPADQLDPLAETHFKFVEALCNNLPGIEIEEVKVESLGEDVFRITAAYRNPGNLPTMTRMGQRNRVPFPLHVTLELPGNSTFISGHARSQVNPISAGGRTEQIWLVRSSGGKAHVTIKSPAVGSDSKEVTIP